MKTIFFLTIMTSLIAFFPVYGQIKLKTDGKIGIGTTTPSYLLHIKLNQTTNNEILYDFPGSIPDLRIWSYYGGDILIEPSINDKGYIGLNNRWFDVKSKYVHCYDLIESSDMRLKENITGLTNSLSKIKKLKGVSYNFKSENNKRPYAINPSLKEFGLISQEVALVVPEVVTYDSIKDEYGISYTRLVPLLIESIKELDSIITEQNIKLEGLQKQIENKNIALKAGDVPLNDIIGIQQSNLSLPVLYQNSPNPFNQSTKISYYLPETTINSAIYIYNMEGLQIKSIILSQKGTAFITLDGNELKAGMYLYTLISDSKVVDTKRMILTK